MFMNFDDNFFSNMGSDPWTEYMVDRAQRSLLYLDVMHQRSRQYIEHMEDDEPHVLYFDFEKVMSGDDLPQPVNYYLLQVKPRDGTYIDPQNRPFVIIDPRAGHGPGIGGFKPESEIGVALRAGHPCYFIGFLPTPVKGQTIDDIITAEGKFLKCIVERHPQADGKPVIIGNCQAGWAAMMLAATHPDLCGPVITAGSPLSYWQGVRGKYPMRYTGGLLAGSWLAALLSDLGDGTFDGAWLVQNFENLNPANTLWGKQYNLFRNVDTEASRYLGFERWWGGHVFLTDKEIQYIVDNLFVGNKLATSELKYGKNRKIDFRNIGAPIICFCSKGDNITPPQQALGWILDLYEDENDLRASGQTIVYCVHESVGHLGIFVSAGVSKKEHTELAGNIELIDCLPPGLYEAIFEEKTDSTENAALVKDNHVTRFYRRDFDDIRALGCNTEEDDQCFMAVAKLSEIGYGMYRTLLQPYIQSMTTEATAKMFFDYHPLRLGYKMFSDKYFPVEQFEEAVDWVKENRQALPKDSNNIFLLYETLFSDILTNNLEIFRQWCEAMSEIMFFSIYAQPWLHAALGLKGSEEFARKRPGQELIHVINSSQRIGKVMQNIAKGGRSEALVRALLYVCMSSKNFDEREFEVMKQVRKKYIPDISLVEFKEMVHDQHFMLIMSETRALETLPALLKGYEEHFSEFYKQVERLATASGKLKYGAEKRLARLKEILLG